jgi:adenylosuccinate lyase
MKLSNLTALSPLDGRYHEKVAELQPIFSEYGLMRHRLLIEVSWLKLLASEPVIAEVSALTPDALHYLEDLVSNFSDTDAQQIKGLEAKTNHDVKAVEYFLKQRMAERAELLPLLEFVHFACTSEDINNLSYALMLKTARDTCLLPAAQTLLAKLKHLAHAHAAEPMLARTHGQPASPTTVGKEFANFAARLQHALVTLAEVAILAKFNGAVGNFNAHYIAYPEVDWLALSGQLIEQLGLQANPYTTQIEPHDYIAELSHAQMRCNTLLIDLCRDCWTYISLGYFTQQATAHEVGSSTMPHKINPIDFENAEGNLGIANALFSYFAQQLPTSRLQRDLVDSTVLRNLGVAMGHSLLAMQSLQKGLAKLKLNQARLQQDLSANWEVLAEAIQTVMRRYGLPEPYEQLKSLTRGHKVTQQSLHKFILELPLPEQIKQQLACLTPASYLGIACKLAKEI